MLPLPISRDCGTADCGSDCKERCCCSCSEDVAVKAKLPKIPRAMYTSKQYFVNEFACCAYSFGAFAIQCFNFYLSCFRIISIHR